MTDPKKPSLEISTLVVMAYHKNISEKYDLVKETFRYLESTYDGAYDVRHEIWLEENILELEAALNLGRYKTIVFAGTETPDVVKAVISVTSDMGLTFDDNLVDPLSDLGKQIDYQLDVKNQINKRTK